MSQKRRVDHWIFITIILVVVFSAFIIYDKSPTFRKNVNDVLDLKELTANSNITLKLNVLTDSTLSDIPYDLDEYINSLNEESDASFKTEYIEIYDEAGIALAEQYDLHTYPVLLFDQDLEKTSLFKDIGPFLSKKDDKYLLKLMPYGFLSYPTVGDAHLKGLLYDTAPTTIIEYGSFTCEHCAEMNGIFNQALTEYPDKIRFAYKHISQDSTELLLANAAECAGELGKYWEMHDAIFEKHVYLSEGNIDEKLLGVANELQIDVNAFSICLSENRYADKIKQHTDEAYRYALTSTPAIFVNNEFIDGSISYESLKQILNK